MLSFVLALGLFAFAQANNGLLEWQDCGSGEHRSIFVKELWLKDRPISIPGQLNALLDAELTKPMGGSVSVDLKMWKYVVGIGFLVPCITIGEEKVGSCVYDDMCGLLKKAADKLKVKLQAAGDCPAYTKIKDLFGVDCATANAIKSQILKDECVKHVGDMVGAQCLKLACPFPVHKYKTANMVSVNLPALKDVPGIIANGIYKIEVRLTDKTAGVEMGCINFKFDLKLN